MKLHTHIALFLAVAIYIANPLLSCCAQEMSSMIGGTSAAVAEEIETTVRISAETAQGCHDSGSTPREDRACPGCDECLSMQVKEQVATLHATLSVDQPAALAILPEENWSYRVSPLAEHRLLPPSTAPPIHSTPVTLKTLLLI